MKLVSIIVPVYCVERYITKCVESLFSCGKKDILNDISAILVDDGSKDNSGILSDESAFCNSCITVVHKRNDGLSSARNAGLDICCSEYVTFLDSDDIVENDFLLAVEKLVQKEVAITTLSFSVDFYENGTSTQYKMQDGIFPAPSAIVELDKNNSFNISCSKVYKRSLIEREPPIRFVSHADPGEDLIFNCECFKRAETVQLSSSVLYHWIRRGEDTLANKFREDLWDKNRFFISCRNALYEHWRLTEPEEKEQLYAGNLEYVFCCVPNMYRGKGKTFRRTKRMAFYREILADKEIALWVKESKTSSLLMKLFLSLYKSRSALMMDFVFSVLMGMRNTFNGLWIAVRQKAQR